MRSSVSRGGWIPWVAFALAFAPAIVSLARFFWAGEVPVDRASLVGTALFAWSIGSRGGERGRMGRTDGAMLLLAACVLQLLGISSDSWSMAHIAIPMGIVGLARFLGAPALSSAALAFFAVPPPFFLTAGLSPDLEGGFASIGSAIANAGGLPIRSSVWTLEGPSGGIDLMPADGGLALAHMMAGIGWFSGVRARAGIARCALGSLISGLAAFPIQLAGVIMAAVATGAGAPDLGLFVLRDALWPLAALLGIVAVLQQPSPTPSQAGL